VIHRFDAAPMEHIDLVAAPKVLMKAGHIPAACKVHDRFVSIASVACFVFVAPVEFVMLFLAASQAVYELGQRVRSMLLSPFLAMALDM
jgi:hypothetical protein